MNENQAMMLERSMRSVFVGNIPFDLTEEKLKEIFSEVGPVLSFKLVYDRENGKPKGYGFCEYKDVETANSAMRNLNAYEIGGRVLKVDNAANEKTRMELQNSISEPIVENVFEHLDPEKVPEAISKAVASLPPEQMFELMKQMKQCIQNNPHEARAMLLQNPQLAYGLLQSLVVMKIVDPEIALTMLSKPNNLPDLMKSESRPVQQNRQDVGPQQQMQMNHNHNMSPHVGQNMPQINPMNHNNMPPQINSSNQNLSQPPPMNQNPINPNMAHSMNQNMLPPMNTMSQNMTPQMNISIPPPMNPNLPPQISQSMNPMNPNVTPQMGNNMGDWPGSSDIERPLDQRTRMGGMSGMSGMSMGSGDVDLRTQIPMPVPAPVMPILPNSQSIPDSGMRDPRQPPPLPAAPPRDPRASDPRSNASGGSQPPLPRQPPPLPKAKVGAPTAGGAAPAAGMASMLGDGVTDQEKAALIMQVLQLTNEQIAMLPAEQRQSILLLKEQIAKSSQR